MSLKFLHLKGWHPGNKANQKRIWVAEQTAKAREQREAEAAREVRQSADARRFQQLAAAGGDAEAARRLDAQQVGFLYAAPPGLQTAEGPAADAGDSDGASQQLAEDDAAREFRRKVERTRGADDARRNLERYVGRRPDEPLTIRDQVERFPFLKDAPVQGAYTDSVKVNFKPVGRQLRNVRCLRCGHWGHQSGDRECELRDANPLDAARQVLEDPMTLIKSASQSVKQQLVLRRAALPLEMRGEAASDEFAILPSDDEDPEREFLASLSTREKKRLLKKLKAQAAERRGDSSDADSSSSDSSGDHDRRHGRGKKRSKKRRQEKARSRERRHSRARFEGESDRRRQRRRSQEWSVSPKRRDDGEGPRKRRHRSRSRSRSEHRRRRHRDA